MIIGVKANFSRSDTAKEILRSASYFDDLGMLLDTTLEQFFNHVRLIPYKMDSDLFEDVARPKYLLDPKYFTALDCKKKTTLISSWLLAHGYHFVTAPEYAQGRDFTLIGLSERPDEQIHHIFPAIVSNGFIKPLDATYSEFKMFEGKPLATEAIFLP